MKTVTVTVLKRHPYGKEVRRPGQICQVEEGHVFLLRELGLIKTADIPVVKKPLAEFVEAEKPAPAEEPEEPEKPKRRRYRYKRRDLMAEAEE